MDKLIPLYKPCVSDEIIDGIKVTLKKCAETGEFTISDETAIFEKSFEKLYECKHAIAVASGTAALHLALLACGVGKNDEVITTPFTFIATLEVVWQVGAKPVLADIDPHTWTLDPDEVESKITSKTKAIIPVHIYGHPTDMDPIIEVAKKEDLFIIEDCAQALCAKYKNKKVGLIGDLGCFSFHPQKHLTVLGDGGMVVSNNAELVEKIQMIRDHGRKVVDRAQGYKRADYSEIPGLNYRMGEIKAAIGEAMLKHENEWIGRRRKIASKYNHALDELDLGYQGESEWAYHTYNYYGILGQNEKQSADLREWLRGKGIACNGAERLLCHRQPVYLKLMGKESFPVSENIAHRSFIIPMYPTLSEDEVDYIIDNIREGLKTEG